VTSPLTPEEHAAALLQCRMSWPAAERCAADLAAAGLPAISRQDATDVLGRRLSHESATACADDLAREGLTCG
jgi:hypothetical protein